MSEMPERIWVEDFDGDFGHWHVPKSEEWAVPYLRADLVDSLRRERDALAKALETIQEQAHNLLWLRPSAAQKDATIGAIEDIARSALAALEDADG